jgi:hypothetical protein
MCVPLHLRAMPFVEPLEPPLHDMGSEDLFCMRLRRYLLTGLMAAGLSAVPMLAQSGSGSGSGGGSGASGSPTSQSGSATGSGSAATGSDSGTSGGMAGTNAGSYGQDRSGNTHNYGWIGLLGLAGLSGLMRGKSTNHVDTRTPGSSRI